MLNPHYIRIPEFGNVHNSWIYCACGDSTHGVPSRALKWILGVGPQRWYHRLFRKIAVGSARLDLWDRPSMDYDERFVSMQRHAVDQNLRALRAASNQLRGFGSTPSSGNTLTGRGLNIT